MKFVAVLFTVLTLLQASAYASDGSVTLARSTVTFLNSEKCRSCNVFLNLSEDGSYCYTNHNPYDENNPATGEVETSVSCEYLKAFRNLGMELHKNGFKYARGAQGFENGFIRATDRAHTNFYGNVAVDAGSGSILCVQQTQRGGFAVDSVALHALTVDQCAGLFDSPEEKEIVRKVYQKYGLN